MPYQKPGAYARFVRTASAVNSPGATRVLALVGTGKLFFDKLNEATLRTPGASSDVLANAGVSEIYEIADKPMKNGFTADGAKVWTKGTHFDLIDNQIVAWKLKAEPTVVQQAPVGDGATAFAGAITAALGTNSHLVKDATYRIEVTYVDNNFADGPTGGNLQFGTFAVVNHDTEEVLGEFSVGADAVNAIPGVDLIVTDTFFALKDVNGDNVIDETTGLVKSITKEGDFVLVKTTAGVLDDALGLPAAGSIFYASYSYRKPESEFKPKVFTDYNEVVAEYGNYDITASGKVINSLALGAEIAFLNGVQPLVLVQSKNDSDFEIKKAIDMLERDVPGISNVNTIVPLTDSKAVAAYLMEHVNNMSSPQVGKERMMYAAADETETATASADAAEGFSNERVVYVAPGSAVKEVKDIATGRISQRRVPGVYLAIAVAAIGLKNDPAEPLTMKNITGFSDLGILYSESEKNIMAEKGVLVLEQVGANMRVRHGITTSTTEVDSSEITMVQVKDYVIQAVRDILGNLYVGRKLMPTVTNDMQGTLQNTLAQFAAQEVILSFGGVSVKRSLEDPRAVDVQFELEAIYPLNFINISFSFSGVA